MEKCTKRESTQDRASKETKSVQGAAKSKHVRGRESMSKRVHKRVGGKVCTREEWHERMKEETHQTMEREAVLERESMWLKECMPRWGVHAQEETEGLRHEKAHEKESTSERKGEHIKGKHARKGNQAEQRGNVWEKWSVREGMEARVKV